MHIHPSAKRLFSFSGSTGNPTVPRAPSPDERKTQFRCGNTIQR